MSKYGYLSISVIPFDFEITRVDCLCRTNGLCSVSPDLMTRIGCSVVDKDQDYQSRPRGYKTFFMPNYEIFPAHKHL